MRSRDCCHRGGDPEERAADRDEFLTERPEALRERTVDVAFDIDAGEAEDWARWFAGDDRGALVYPDHRRCSYDCSSRAVKYCECQRLIRTGGVRDTYTTGVTVAAVMVFLGMHRNELQNDVAAGPKWSRAAMTWSFSLPLQFPTLTRVPKRRRTAVGEMEWKRMV